MLSLNDNVLAKTRTMVDDDEKTAKDLWEELHRIFTTLGAQAIANLHNKLDSLVFDENKNWDD